MTTVFTWINGDKLSDSEEGKRKPPADRKEALIQPQPPGSWLPEVTRRRCVSQVVPRLIGSPLLLLVVVMQFLGRLSAPVESECRKRGREFSLMGSE